MVKASVENNTVAHVLTDQDTVTVPNGEVWDCYVTLSMQENDGGSHNDIVLNVNGTAIYTGLDSDVRAQDGAEMVFVGGDTLECIAPDDDGSNPHGVYISGYVVSE